MIFNTTVDSIVKQFTKMQAQLDSLINTNTAIIESNNQIVSDYQENTRTRNIEIHRAKIIKNNINNIFSV